MVLVHRESKKGATLTMAITLSILIDLQNSSTAANSSKFPTKSIIGYPPHLMLLRCFGKFKIRNFALFMHVKRFKCEFVSSVVRKIFIKYHENKCKD